MSYRDVATSARSTTSTNQPQAGSPAPTRQFGAAIGNVPSEPPAKRVPVGDPTAPPSAEQLSTALSQMTALVQSLAPALSGLQALPGLLEKLNTSPATTAAASGAATGAASPGQGSQPPDNSGNPPTSPPQHDLAAAIRSAVAAGEKKVVNTLRALNSTHNDKASWETALAECSVTPLPCQTAQRGRSYPTEAIATASGRHLRPGATSWTTAAFCPHSRHRVAPPAGYATPPLHPRAIAPSELNCRIP